MLELFTFYLPKIKDKFYQKLIYDQRPLKREVGIMKCNPL